MAGKTMYVFFWQFQDEGTKIIIHKQETDAPEETEAFRKLIWMVRNGVVTSYGYEPFIKNRKDRYNYFFSPYPFTNAPEGFKV